MLNDYEGIKIMTDLLNDENLPYRSQDIKLIKDWDNI